MSTTIRSFIAMDLPASVVRRLEDAQQGLKALKLRAKWVRPENIHLTLRFLGNISPGRIDAIARANRIAAVSVQGAGTQSSFPSADELPGDLFA
jgi:2'-5' RNA ligase